MEATTSSLFAELARRGGERVGLETAIGLRELASTMVAMADGTATPHFFLSSLDPGLGKTTTVTSFVQELLRSEQHEDAAVLLCFSRLEEISRLVVDLRLGKDDFAVLTSDEETNKLSSAAPSEARVLLTTHAMVMNRCRGRHFKDAGVFYYLG